MPQTQSPVGSAANFADGNAKMPIFRAVARKAARAAFAGVLFAFVGQSAAASITSRPAKRSPPATTTSGENKLEIHGVASISAPLGFTWKVAKKYVPQSFGSYDATNGTHSALVLVVEDATPNSDEARSAAARSFFERQKKLIIKHFGDVTAQPLDIKTPTPDRITRSFITKAPDGAQVYFRSEIIFGQFTYCLTAMSNSVDESWQLVQSDATLQEAKKAASN